MPTPQHEINFAEVRSGMEDTTGTFGFTVTHEGKALGKVLADEVVEGISDRSFVEQSAPSTGTWPENSDEPPGRYRSRKRRQYGVEQTNFRTGQMISKESMLGKVNVSRELVEIIYGTGQPPTHSRTGRGFDPQSDGKVTDEEKAHYADLGGRAFFELDEHICNETFETLSRALDQFLEQPQK